MGTFTAAHWPLAQGRTWYRAAPPPAWWDWVTLVTGAVNAYLMLLSYQVGEWWWVAFNGTASLCATLVCRWVPWPHRVRRGLLVLALLAWVMTAGVLLWSWWVRVPPGILYLPSCTDCVPV
jgi:hypothetical protein